MEERTMMSKHAKKRMRQRGFRKFDLEIVRLLGEVKPAPGGATATVMTAKIASEAMRALGRMKNGAVIIELGETEKTVYKLYE